MFDFFVFKLTDKRSEDVLNAHYTTPAAEGLNLYSSLYKAGQIFKHDYGICIEYEFLLPNIERFIINGNISFYFKNFFYHLEIVEIQNNFYNQSYTKTIFMIEICVFVMNRTKDNRKTKAI